MHRKQLSQMSIILMLFFFIKPCSHVTFTFVSTSTFVSKFNIMPITKTNIENRSGSILVVTVRKRSCGKIMLSQVCVKNSVHRGGCTPSRQTPLPLGRHPPPTDTPGQTPLGRHPPPPWADTHLPLGRPPSRANSCCSGRYATYWNSFLFAFKLP